MSDPRDDDNELQLADPRREDFMTSLATQQEVLPPGMQMVPLQVGNMFGSVITAQEIKRPRDHVKLMQKLKALASSFGDTYIYAWDVKDKNSKRADGKTTIEGPTIKLAMDLAREYGNCDVDIREIEGPTHWIFYSRFADCETGYSLTRAFRQRKNAMQGKYQDDRKLDMSYQQGQSKAERNVVVNALRNYVEFMFEEAKKAQLQRFKDDPEKYIEAINRGLTKFKIALQSVEAQIGRKQSEWNARDIAKVYNTLAAINDGMVDASEAFPQDGPDIADPETGEIKEKKESSGAKTADDEAKASAASGEAKGGSSKLRTASPDEAKEEPKATLKEEPKPKAEKKAAAPKPRALFGEE